MKKFLNAFFIIALVCAEIGDSDPSCNENFNQFLQVPKIEYEPQNKLKIYNEYGKTTHFLLNTETKRPIQPILTKYDANIILDVAQIKLESTYENPSNEIIQVEYLFSINNQAALTKLQVYKGEEVFSGLIKEKQVAKEEYEQGVMEGHTMIYVEYDNTYPDIIKIKIGNLQPNTSLRIQLEYIEQLEVRMNQLYRFEISSMVRERYHLDYIEKLINFEDYSIQNYPQIIKVNLTTQEQLNLLKSPSHEIEQREETENGLYKHVIDVKGSDPSKSFILYFSHNNINKPNTHLTKQGSEFILTTTFIPDFYRDLNVLSAYEQTLKDYTFQNIKGEYIFLLDRSGSMNGSRMSQALQALQLFIKSLPINSLFNIVSFGTTYEMMWQESQPYNQENVDQAIVKIASMRANLGGTEILNPLSYLLQQEVIQNYTKNIFILTDGEVTPDPIINLVRQKQSGNLRIYTIGIGDGYSQYLIQQLAIVGNGKYSSVSSNESVDKAVIDLLTDSLSPFLTDFTIQTNFKCDTIIPNPKSIISIKKNTPITFHFIMSEIKGRELSAIISYKDGEYFNSQVSTIQTQKMIDTPIFQQIAVFKQIKAIENAIQFQQTEVNSILSFKDKFTIQWLINLSLQYQILSKYTAFITKIENEQANMKEAGVFSRAKYSVKYNRARITPQIEYDQFEVARNDNLIQEDNNELEENQKSYVPRKPTGYFEIIGFLKLDGSYELDKNLLEFIGYHWKVRPLDIQDDVVWVTLLTMQFLEQQYPQEKQKYQLVFHKNIEFLKSHNIDYYSYLQQ